MKHLSLFHLPWKINGMLVMNFTLKFNNNHARWSLPLIKDKAEVSYRLTSALQTWKYEKVTLTQPLINMSKEIQ